MIFPHNFDRDGVKDGVPPGSYDGVDLLVRPHHTVTFRVPLSPKAQKLLQRRRKVLVDVLIELNTKPVVRANEQLKIPLVTARA